MSADTREQLLQSLSGLIEQSTALADALGLEDAAADLRCVRVPMSGAAGDRALPHA